MNLIGLSDIFNFICKSIPNADFLKLKYFCLIKCLRLLKTYVVLKEFLCDIASFDLLIEAISKLVLVVKIKLILKITKFFYTTT